MKCASHVLLSYHCELLSKVPGNLIALGYNLSLVCLLLMLSLFETNDTLESP